MPWRKLLKVTSKWHVYAVLYYLFQTFLGLIFTVGSVQPIRYISEAAGSNGEQLARSWALLLLVGGVLGILSMFHKDVEEYLVIESISAAIIAAMMTWLYVSMSLTAHLTPVGVILIAYFGVAGWGRCIQTVYELRKVRAGKKAALVATAEEYLAAPVDES